MKYQINLLAQKEETILDRMIFFSLNYLRYILVITQIVVIGVFFYKFYVDQRIADLKESVDQKKEIITVSQPLLKEAQILDFKLKQSSDVISRQNTMLEMMAYVRDSFPKDLVLTKLDINQNAVTMDGNTPNASILQAFYQHFKMDNKFKSVNLLDIKKSDLGYEFTLKLSNFGSVPPAKGGHGG